MLHKSQITFSQLVSERLCCTDVRTDVTGKTESHSACKPGAQEVTVPFGRWDTLIKDTVTEEA